MFKYELKRKIEELEVMVKNRNVVIANAQEEIKSLKTALEKKNSDSQHAHL